MKNLLLFSLICFCSLNALAQNDLLVQNNASGKTKRIHRGKVIGLVVSNGDTLKHNCCNDVNGNYWVLADFTDSTITAEHFATKQRESYFISDILSVTFQQKNKNPVLGGQGAFSIFCAGAFLTLISPVAGIEENEPYNFTRAGIVMGTGLTIAGLTLWDLSGQKSKTYSILGLK